MSALPDTRPTPRPSPRAPQGWRSAAHADGTTTWTWSDGGVPVCSVLVSARGEVAPPLLRDPERYWMQGGAFARAASALAELGRFVAAGGLR